MCLVFCCPDEGAAVRAARPSNACGDTCSRAPRVCVVWDEAVSYVRRALLVAAVFVAGTLFARQAGLALARARVAEGRVEVAFRAFGRVAYDSVDD